MNRSSRAGQVLALAVAFLLGAGAGVGGTVATSRIWSNQPAATSTPAATNASPRPSGPGSPGPRPRTDPGWAFDIAIQKFVLFGGTYTTGTYHGDRQPLGDTWTWDGTRWSEVTGTSPVARLNPAMVYDAAHSLVVLHNGTQLNGPLINDTWTWNGTSWRLMGTQQTPPALQGQAHTMIWEPEHKVVDAFVWVGNGRLTELSQIWTWDGANWSQLDVPQLTSPDAPSWDAIDVFPISQPATAYDAARKSTVIFGHLQATPVTWTFDGKTWSQSATHAGSASTRFTVAPDDARSDVMLFGQNADTWTWDGTNWTAKSPAHSPSARTGAVMAYDSVHHLVVLFGGLSGSGADSKELNDVWTWDGVDWTQRA